MYLGQEYKGWNNMTLRAEKQTTLADSVTLNGIGVHSGNPASITLHPADANSGIVFHRSTKTGYCGDRSQLEECECDLPLYRSWGPLCEWYLYGGTPYGCFTRHGC